VEALYRERYQGFTVVSGGAILPTCDI
jgi:hypothetical protein